MVFGIVVAAALANPTSLTAVASPNGLATLTLVARTYPTFGEELPITDQRLVLIASGSGGTLSGPPGTTGQLPVGTYALTTGPTDLEVINFGDLGEIVCTNARSGVSEVTLNVGEHVVCTFEFVPGPAALTAQPPNVVAPHGRLGSRMPVTGASTTRAAVAGTVLVVFRAALVMLSRRRYPSGTISDR